MELQMERTATSPAVQGSACQGIGWMDGWTEPLGRRQEKASGVSRHRWSPTSPGKRMELHPRSLWGFQMAASLDDRD